MVRVPAQVRRLDWIHRDVMGAEKWALGIFERGDRNAGVMTNL